METSENRQKTISGTKNDIRDKNRYQGDISFLSPPVINLIKAQVYVIINIYGLFRQAKHIARVVLTDDMFAFRTRCNEHGGGGGGGGDVRVCN